MTSLCRPRFVARTEAEDNDDLSSPHALDTSPASRGAVQKAWDDFARCYRLRRCAFAHRRFIGKPSSAVQAESDRLRQQVQQVQKVHDDYDTKTDHGRKQTPPTIIDLSANCGDAGS